jgi:hypothetical protein
VISGDRAFLWCGHLSRFVRELLGHGDARSTARYTRSIARRIRLSPSMNTPPDDPLRDCRAHCVDRHVHRRRRSRRDKALVELVARRNQERDHDRDRCPSSRPSAPLRAHGAKCQRPENGVFRQVGELPDHEVQRVELFRRKRMADDRGDDRLDHRSRMLRRESARRSHEDHGRPREQGKPVAEERARHDSVAKRAFVGCIH